MTRIEVAAAAPVWVRERLDAPVREARVVHGGADALYVAADEWCLGVLTRDAVAVPCGMQTTLSSFPDIRAPGYATIGHGTLRMSALEVRVGRVVDASVPTLERTDEAARLLHKAAGDRLDGVRSELPYEALRALEDADPAAVPALLGRGSGLTPVGDDVLSGWLAAARAIGSADTDAVVRVVERDAPGATTLLSATLLHRACAGDVIPAFRQLLLALREPTYLAVAESSDMLMDIGHTSGAGMLLGATLALDPSSTTADPAHRRKP